MRNNRTFGHWLRQKRGHFSLGVMEEGPRALDGRGLSDTHLCQIKQRKRAISNFARVEFKVGPHRKRRRRRPEPRR